MVFVLGVTPKIFVDENSVETKQEEDDDDGFLSCFLLLFFLASLICSKSYAFCALEASCMCS